MKLCKTLSSLLAFVLAASAFAGCTPKQQSNVSGSATSSDTSSTSEASSTANTDEKVTLVVGLQQNANVEDYETNYLTRYVEENNNVNLDFLLLPGVQEDARTKFSLMVTSGTELPDILMVELTDLGALDYAKKGIFQDITSYYDDPAITPNINATKSKDYIVANMKLADGKIYSIPKFTEYFWNEGAYRYWVNKDWLDAVDMEKPTTTDEFYDMVKAFVEQDPNGNGQKDEIGISGSVDGWGQDPIMFLMNAFTYANKDQKQNYLHVENGKVYASYMKPEWKDGLEYLNKLVTDGLLSPLSFTQDSTQLKALATSETATVGVVATASFSTFNNVGPAAERMTLLAPLTGPKGECNVSQTPQLPIGIWYITKDCENVEKAISVGDFFLNDKTSLIAQQGEENVNWTSDPAQCSEWVGQFVDTPVWITLGDAKVWGVPGNTIWQEGPRYERWDYRIGKPYVSKADLPTYKIENYNKIHYETYFPLYPKEVISRLVYSEDEIEQVSALQTAIRQYVDMSTVEFVTGNRPLSEFDSFIDELNKMGHEEYLRLAQSGYDRSIAQ